MKCKNCPAFYESNYEGDYDSGCNIGIDDDDELFYEDKEGYCGCKRKKKTIQDMLEKIDKEMYKEYRDADIFCKMEDEKIDFLKKMGIDNDFVINEIMNKFHELEYNYHTEVRKRNREENRKSQTNRK